MKISVFPRHALPQTRTITCKKGGVHKLKLRALGLDQIGERAGRIADSLMELADDGWRITGNLWYVALHHPDVQTIAEAERRLDRLGVEKKDCTIVASP